MACSTIFSGFNQPVENKALLIIIKDIKEGRYKADIENIRALIQSGATDKADKLKKQLPAFTPSTTFKGGRKAELLDQYSGFVHLDFDKLSEVQLNTAFQEIARNPYTFACFRSPSGNGLKVFVEVNSGAEQHDNAYREVQMHYEKMLGIDSDPKCKDITRLCFVSDDPETYKNIHNQIFEVNIPETESQTKTQEEEVHSYQKSFEDCVRFIEQKENYQTVQLIICLKSLQENTFPSRNMAVILNVNLFRFTL